MKMRSAVVVAVVAAVIPVTSTNAVAAPLDRGHFHDVDQFSFMCGDTEIQGVADISGSYLLNQRGSSPFPHYRETARGTTVYTNTDTGSTFTSVFNTNSRDQTIVDNGDGTITITSFANGGGRNYDQNGVLVQQDSGQIRVAVDVDYNGTPGNPDDDEEVEGSFRVVRPSNGTNDTQGVDFCDILMEFTS